MVSAAGVLMVAAASFAARLLAPVGISSPQHSSRLVYLLRQGLSACQLVSCVFWQEYHTSTLGRAFPVFHQQLVDTREPQTLVHWVPAASVNMLSNLFCTGNRHKYAVSCQPPCWPSCCHVVSGTFAPNFTIGPPVVGALRKHSSIFLDCHLAVAVSTTQLTTLQGVACRVHVAATAGSPNAYSLWNHYECALDT